MEYLRCYNFNRIYELVDLIDSHVKYKEGFWNYDEDYFISAATRFSKDTLLHQYIVTTAMNYYRRDYRKNGDFFDEEAVKEWNDIFDDFGIKYETYEIDLEDDDVALVWFDKNFDSFLALFDKMADEVFYILFSNRQFLLAFNNLACATVMEVGIPERSLTLKGTIKRVSIPQWVKTAVFHRDKGRCVFCNTDLTTLVNPLSRSNYDHIVPLDLYGTNDPCNIQLACEKCNKSKTNKDGSTSNMYIPWWPD